MLIQPVADVLEDHRLRHFLGFRKPLEHLRSAHIVAGQEEDRHVLFGQPLRHPFAGFLIAEIDVEDRPLRLVARIEGGVGGFGVVERPLNRIPGFRQGRGKIERDDNLVLEDQNVISMRRH